MIRTGILQAYGTKLRQQLGRSLDNRVRAAAAGLGLTILLQSSMATALMAASFAQKGLVSTAAALAVMLGADIGTSLVAQLVSFPVSWLSPLLILVGVIMFMSWDGNRIHDLGRAVVGLGVVLLALRLISETAEPIRESQVMLEVMDAMAGEPILGLLTGVLLTILSTSSLAVVLLMISLAGAGAIEIHLAFSIVLGANLGSGLTPFIAMARTSPEARRVPFGNLVVRLTGVVIALPLIPLLSPALEALQAAPARQIANFHLLFNVTLALLFLPFIHPLASLVTKLLPDRRESEDVGKPRYLDTAALQSPAVAIANAARETLRMGDIIETMLRSTLRVLQENDPRLVKEVEDMDDQVDRLHAAIKFYLTRLNRETLGAEDSKRSIDVITFTTNLEHIGDIIDKNLMELASKKIKNKLSFSPEGFQEIVAIHGRLMENLRLAMNVFLSGDLHMARRLLQEKTAFRELEWAASESHFGRLRKGQPESVETSNLHIDILRDLKRINSHLTSVAYPILERAGQLTRTRLKEEDSLTSAPAPTEIGS